MKLAFRATFLLVDRLLLDAAYVLKTCVIESCCETSML